MRGMFCEAHLPSDDADSYHCYLLVRFILRTASDVDLSETQDWRGINITTGAQVDVRGEPMWMPGLADGRPTGQSGVDPEVLRTHICRLGLEADAALAQMVDAAQDDAARRYRRAFEGLRCAARRDLTLHESEARASEMQKRFAVNAQVSADAVILLWLPA